MNCFHPQDFSNFLSFLKSGKSPYLALTRPPKATALKISPNERHYFSCFIIVLTKFWKRWTKNVLRLLRVGDKERCVVNQTRPIPASLVLLGGHDGGFATSSYSRLIGTIISFPPSLGLPSGRTGSFRQKSVVMLKMASG